MIDIDGKLSTQHTVLSKKVQLFSAAQLRIEFQVLKMFVFDMKDQKKSVVILQHEDKAEAEDKKSGEEEDLDGADIIASFLGSPQRVYSNTHVSAILHIYTTLTVHTTECERGYPL